MWNNGENQSHFILSQTKNQMQLSLIVRITILQR